MDIGYKLKNLRVQQNLTQEELADRSELTKGFISQVERNLTSPSVATLIDILEALGTTPLEFFKDDTQEKIIFNENDYIESVKEDSYIINWLVPNAQKNMMEPTIIELEPMGQSKEVSPFEGEIMGYVLKGEVDLNFGNNVYKVKEKETFYFKADKISFIENKSKTRAQVIWISSPPNF